MLYRRRLPFRAVNRHNDPGYDSALQRHHVLPRAVLGRASFRRMVEGLGLSAIDLDDFRSNGLLLPCRDSAAIRMALPLHRGPHVTYNGLVMERLGQIERHWNRSCGRSPERARQAAQMRIALLQRALRKRLLSPAGERMRLNRFDPHKPSRDFADLDAMAELLWQASDPAG